MASPMADPYRDSSHTRAPARSTSTPASSADGGLRNRHTDTRPRNRTAPPAASPSRIPLPSSPGVPSGSPPRNAGACSRSMARLATNPPAASTTPRRAPTVSGRAYRRSSPATGRCTARPSFGAYRPGLADQRRSSRCASRAQPGAPRSVRACTPTTRPAASVTSRSARVCTSTRAPEPRTAAASRANSSPPDVPRPRTRCPRGAGGAARQADSSLPE